MVGPHIYNAVIRVHGDLAGDAAHLAAHELPLPGAVFLIVAEQVLELVLGRRLLLLADDLDMLGQIRARGAGLNWPCPLPHCRRIDGGQCRIRFQGFQCGPTVGSRADNDLRRIGGGRMRSVRRGRYSSAPSLPGSAAFPPP
jgi:hypothetical protein